ncbi:MAG: four helix bundle protein [Candidatus Peribacteraceae bacterium]|nr:four helix bundle protein [Candidatus Peribacteraceae bacterium]MDP7454737.1 four helix bundle protein [Candidatus Peribacteraceae bacterium]|tara:strand:- start:1042 stop:1452 length:411 start_codon:yes stop_codon:yes gene_type:complete
MNKFRKFEDMKVWQEARNLVREVRSICKRSKACKDFAFIDQITRSSRSVAANIAEGNDAMTNAEFVQFLGYSKRSVSEVRSHLYDALDEEYISKDEFRVLCDKTDKISSMLAKLIHHLQKTDKQFKRTYKEVELTN